jgi:hypothetical protein
VCCWERIRYRGWLGVLVVTLGDVSGRGGSSTLGDGVELLVGSAVAKMLASF